LPLSRNLRRATLLAMILSAAVMLLASPAGAQQACVAPPQGILAWWPFDETTGPTANELIAGRVGTYFGSPTPAPGEVANALRFHGSPDFVGVANDPVWHFGVNDFSIELWANFSAPTGGSIGEPSDIFIGNDDGPGDQNKWFFALGGGFLNFHVNSPTLGPMFFPLAPLTPALNTWYHLAVTRAGALYTLYINGTPVASATNTASIPSPSAFLTIGEAENIGFVNGLLDEVTIYNRALTAAEIQSIWAAGTAGKCKPSSGPALAIASVNPSVGGNAGQVTVSISGAGFEPGAVVNLVTGDPTPLGTGFNTVLSSPGVLQTTFDLTSVSAQSALVQVVNSDGTSATFPFTVMSGGSPQVNLEIVGPATARVGRTAPFVALLQNVGSVNAPLVTITSTFSCPVSGPTTPVTVMPITSGGPVFDPPTSPIQVPLPSAPPVFPSPVLVALQLPTGVPIPVELPIPIPVPSSGPCTVHVQVNWSNPPLPPPPPGSVAISLPFGFCDEFDLEEELLSALLDSLQTLIISINNDEIQLQCDTSEPDDVQQCSELAEDFGDAEKDTNEVTSALTATQSAWYAPLCGPPPIPSPDVPFTNSQSDDAPFTLVTSWDPNAKSGPAGIGPAQVVSGNLLPYTIFFENVASATAPAQQISIVDPLDPSLDENSASLGTLLLGSLSVGIGPGQHASKTVDLRPATNALLQVQADVDTVKRQITWALTAIDPATGQLPTNPGVGILPPDQNPPQGEGYVTFTAPAKQGTPPNTTISNQATVTFDVNPPIQTNVWTNTTQPACASDVTSQFSISRTGYRYNNATGLFMQQVTLTNRGAAVLAPFALAMNGLSSNSTLFGQSGTTACSANPGSPFAAVDPGSTWTSGQSLTVNAEFVDPTKAGITYTPHVLAGSSNR
jgi:hypothetical protein